MTSGIENFKAGDRALANANSMNWLGIDSKNRFDADSKNRLCLPRRAASESSWLRGAIQHI
jgi:hypothetical protein